MAGRLRWEWGGAIALAIGTAGGAGSPHSPAAAGIGDEPKLARFEATETHMGSPFTIVLYTPDLALATRAHRAAFDRIAALDKVMSDYDHESELMRLCDRAGGPPVAVSPALFAILRLSKLWSERTGGAFDVTIAPVGRLWRRARRDRKLPDPDAIRRARLLVGPDRITLDPAAKTVQLAPGTRIDLGGVAKGYASHAAIETLRAMGVPRALVAGAGDVAAGDPPPGRDGWSVAVAALDDPGTAPPDGMLSIARGSASTSGDAERFVEIGGVRYSHIVDPATGLGLTDRMSVTVVVPEGANADALATSIALLGADRGLALASETPGADARIVRRVDGREVRRETPGFAARLRPTNPPAP